MVFVLLSLILFFPGGVAAQEQPSVVINEIAWMGTPIEGVGANQHWRYEWVELFNKTEEEVLLDGWILEFAREEPEFVIPLSGSVVGRGYFLVGASDKIPGVDVNYANLAGKLNNNGMRIVLKDNLGNVTNEVDAREGWEFGDNESKRTMEKTTEGWQTSSSAGGTPRAENSKGLEELLSTATKKDPRRSSQESLNVFNNTTLPALALALLSSGAAVLLRRRLLRA